MKKCETQVMQSIDIVFFFFFFFFVVNFVWQSQSSKGVTIKQMGLFFVLSNGTYTNGV